MQAITYNPAPYVARRNPIVGPGLGVLFGLGGVVGGAYLVKWWMEKGSAQVLGNGKTPIGPGGIPPAELAEIAAVYKQGATLADSKITTVLPFAMNVLGLQGVAGPTVDEFTHMTQPEQLSIRGKSGKAIPLQYIFAREDGEVGLRVDTNAMADRNAPADATLADGTPQGAMAQTGALITNLEPKFAGGVFFAAVAAISNQGAAFDVPSETRDNFVRMLLQKVIPKFDWAGSPGNLMLGQSSFTTSVAQLWHGVSLVAQVAYQNLWNSPQQ